LQCLPDVKPGGGVMENACRYGVRSDPRAIAIPEGEKHPGFRLSVTLRGVTPTRRPRLAYEGGGSIQPAARRAGDNQGMLERAAMRRGTIVNVVLRQRATGGRSFAHGHSARASPAPSANGHRRKRWSHRGVARKRRRGRPTIFGFMSICVLAAQRDRGIEGIDTARGVFAIFLRQGGGHSR